MIDAVSSHCLENNILLGEAPGFVDIILKTSIPFSMVSKAARELKFDYERELGANRKNIDDLPQRIKDSIYAF